MNERRGERENKVFARCHKKMLRISWVERLTNEEGLINVGEGRRFIKHMKLRRAQLIEHLSLIHI